MLKSDIERLLEEIITLISSGGGGVSPTPAPDYTDFLNHIEHDVQTLTQSDMANPIWACYYYISALNNKFTNWTTDRNNISNMLKGVNNILDRVRYHLPFFYLKKCYLHENISSIQLSAIPAASNSCYRKLFVHNLTKVGTLDDYIITVKYSNHTSVDLQFKNNYEMLNSYILSYEEALVSITDNYTFNILDLQFCCMS